MSGAYSIDLRERIVAFVEEGHTHRETAERFKVAISFINKLVKQKRDLGHLILYRLEASGMVNWIRLRIGYGAVLRKKATLLYGN